METLVPLREVRADKRLEIYLADCYIPVVKERLESADMTGMKMGYCYKVKIYLPAGSFFQIPRRMFRVLRVAAVNESESVAALKKNAVRTPGVEKWMRSPSDGTEISSFCAGTGGFLPP